MTRPLVRFEGIRKSYAGRYAAVHGLDLDLERGSFVTLLGPSGCGKTTTLRMLGGFETPDAGRILLDGQDITALPPEQRHVNMVFQDYALFTHLTVAQNVAFGMELQRLPRAQIAARVEELLALVDLSGVSGRKPAQLSGGQRQRVALARALAPDPEVLLLDEPLAALDAKLRAQMQFELKALQRRTGKTFLFVTHDQEEALALSDRIIVMNKGRIEQSGSPEDLYYRPTSRFVADFVGTSSRLSGRVTRVNGDGAEIEGPGFRLRSEGVAADLAPGTLADVFLRPEALRLNPAENTSSGGQAVLHARAFIGGRTLLELRLQDGAELLAYLAPGEPEPPLGTPLTFAADARDVVLFPQ